MSYVPFEEYEAVILLYMTQWAEQNEITIRYAAIILSGILRSIAVQQGIEFDKSFRSVGGLTYQIKMMSVELAKKGHISDPKSIISKTAYEYYHHTEDENIEVLMEALNMSADNNNKKAFLKYITLKKPSSAADIYIIMDQVESIAQTKGIIEGSLYDGLTSAKIGLIESNVILDGRISDLERKMKTRFRMGFSLLREFASSDMYNSATDTISTDNTDKKPLDVSDAEGKEYTTNPDIHTVNARSKPVSFTYYLKNVSVTSWEEMYVKFMRILWSEKRILSSYIGHSVLNDDVIDFVRTSGRSSQKHSVLIANDVYLETKLDPESILTRIEKIMRICGVPAKRLSITYTDNAGAESESTEVKMPVEKDSEQKPERGIMNPDTRPVYLEKDTHYEPTCEADPNNEWIIEELRARGLEYNDKRDLGGCLWIVGGKELNEFSDDCYEKGYYLSYKPDGCKTYPDRAVWWTKDRTRNGKDTVGDDKSERKVVPAPVTKRSADDRWEPILSESFTDGYILNDFLSQFQAAAFWQERYGEQCPIEGVEIDKAMKAIGSVIDGRVFAKKDNDGELIKKICSEIDNILVKYTGVYRSCIYERYRDELAAISIYTEQVMTQQLIKQSGGSFYTTYQVFAASGKDASVIADCRQVMLDHGGAMKVDDIAGELWFIPRDIIYHNLSVDSETINIGSGTWMLVEHFPLSEEEANQIGNILDNYFIAHDHIQQFDLMPLLSKEMPQLADNLSGLHFTAIFNILNYYLKGRFSFSKAIIAPQGAKKDFRDLFKTFVSERESFTFDELDAYAKEINIRIYWGSVFDGGAVRISQNDFINRKLIEFDIDGTDNVLESICTGDYLSLQAISEAMMMHLPACGYAWNGYLLLSYLFRFSKTFKLSYNTLGKTGYFGAIVRRSCTKIESYEQLAEQVLTDDNTWQNDEEALALLVREGYQARHRLNGIEKITARAKQNKLKDGR